MTAARPNTRIPEHPSLSVRIGQALQRYFITGLAALLPVVLTVGVVVWIDNKLRDLLGVDVPGLGLLVTFLLILAVGVFTVHLFGRVVFRTIEVWFNHLPIVRKIYPPVKQLVQFVFGEQGAQQTFRRAVLVEYPRRGTHTLAFVTNETKTSATGSPKTLLTLLIPQPPSPFTGPIIFVPDDEVIPLDLLVEDAIKLIVSAGVVSAPLRALKPPAA